MKDDLLDDLLADIDKALMANNMSPDISFKEEHCQCDAETGMVPCPYCAIHYALTMSKKFISSVLLKE